MRISYMNDRGVLELNTRYSNTVSLKLQFEPYTMQDWLPFNTQYEWRTYKDEIILVDTYHACTDKILGRTYLNTQLWYNDKVRKDNLRIACFASVMGISSPFSPYNADEVSDGFNKLGNQIDQFCAQHTISLIESGKPYYRNSVGSLESYAMRELKDPDKKLFARLGEVYNMLGEMRKVVKYEPSESA